jgi:hypothetical protein
MFGIGAIDAFDGDREGAVFECSNPAFCSDMPEMTVVALSCIKGFSMCKHGERGSVGDAELAINMVQMDLHGSLGHS